MADTGWTPARTASRSAWTTVLLVCLFPALAAGAVALVGPTLAFLSASSPLWVTALEGLVAGALGMALLGGTLWVAERLPEWLPTSGHGLRLLLRGAVMVLYALVVVYGGLAVVVSGALYFILSGMHC